VQNIDANRLARLCAFSAEAEEWTLFIAQITPTIALAARRMCALWGDVSSATVHDIVQDVFVRLCEDDRRVLREFDDRGNESFLKLLRVMASSITTDHFRRVNADKRGGRCTEISLDDPHAVEEISASRDTEAVEWAAMISQLDGLLRKNGGRISARDRSLFWLYYRQGFTAEAISAIPDMGLSTKGVESALLRITRQLRETVQNGPENPPSTGKIVISTMKRKGFSPFVAVDNMKHR